MDNIKVLLIGKSKKLNNLAFPSYVKVFTEDDIGFENASNTSFDLTFVLSAPDYSLITRLHKVIKAYTMYVVDGLFSSPRFDELIMCKKAMILSEDEVQHFITYNIMNFFPKPYGEKYGINKLTPAYGFNGLVKYDGNYSLNLEGDFGNQLGQIAYFRMYIPFHRNSCLDYWLEYEKDDSVEVALDLTMYKSKCIAEEEKHWIFTEDELAEPVSIEAGNDDGYLFMSISAKGAGRLKIIALHSRYGRRGFGHFIPGGERFATSNREEVFAYFDPGDMKPPLNVYFSGYKTKEGFEGYNMMRNLGSPFLLISEPRLEGGAFYLGSDEYENIITGKIKTCLDELGFTNKELVLSGISMGSFGAAYYGCDLNPRAVILGKPLLNVGTIAKNERLVRPGGFPTSLDVLKHNSLGMNDKSVDFLNDRLWNKFSKSNWENTMFIVSYMYEDDYDKGAYGDLISKLSGAGVEVYGRGLHGRHNDNTGGIFQWFIAQHQNILEREYKRSL